MSNAIDLGLRANDENVSGNVIAAAIASMSAKSRLPPKTLAVAARTSRRRRLWELSSKSHCPIIGACFDVAELRKMIGKIMKYPPDTTDYVWHSVAVGVCDKRCLLSEQFNRLLDRRYSLMIRHMAKCKTADELRNAWLDVCRIGTEIPAGLWAACTHPACNGDLELEIHGDIHMIQHQVGATARVDKTLLKDVQSENGRLKNELDSTQKRWELQRAEYVQAVDGLNRRIAELQAQLSALIVGNAKLRAEVSRLGEVTPNLADRELILARARDAEAAARAERDRGRQLEKEVARLSDFARFAEATIESLTQDVAAADGPLSGDQWLEATRKESLLGQCVLCVGGRSGAVTSYREAVEQCGGRFMHHDGGREESLHRIDGALAAADIVICQVGCISHNAYWRVKEQCKRTGKPCMFVKNPGLASFGKMLDVARKK